MRQQPGRWCRFVLPAAAGQVGGPLPWRCQESSNGQPMCTPVPHGLSSALLCFSCAARGGGRSRHVPHLSIFKSGHPRGGPQPGMGQATGHQGHPAWGWGKQQLPLSCPSPDGTSGAQLRQSIPELPWEGITKTPTPHHRPLQTQDCTQTATPELLPRLPHTQPITAVPTQHMQTPPHYTTLHTTSSPTPYGPPITHITPHITPTPQTAPQTRHTETPTHPKTLFQRTRTTSDPYHRCTPLYPSTSFPTTSCTCNPTHE